MDSSAGHCSNVKSLRQPAHAAHLLLLFLWLSTGGCLEDEWRLPEPVGWTGPPAFSITTEALPDAFVDSRYSVQIEVDGADPSWLDWSIPAGRLPQGLDVREGEISGYPEAVETALFTVQAAGDGVDQSTYEIRVLETTDRPLDILPEATRLPDANMLDPYSVLLKAQPATREDGVEWTLWPEGLPKSSLRLEKDFDGVRVTGFIDESRGSGFFSVRVTAEDRNGRRADKTYELWVDPEVPPLTLRWIPEGLTLTPGIPLDLEIQVRGGTGRAYDLRLVHGALPGDMELVRVENGVYKMRGTPTRGAHAFQLEVSDSRETPARESYFLEVGPVHPPLQIVTFQLPEARLGQMYEASVRGVNGSAEGYAWQVDEGLLPPGLSLESGTPEARLVGTPTELGNFAFSLRLTDTEGNTTAFAYELEVKAR